MEQDKLVEAINSVLCEARDSGSAAHFAKTLHSDMIKFRKLQETRVAAILKNQPKELEAFSKANIHLGLDHIDTEYVAKTLEQKQWAKVKTRWSVEQIRDYVHTKILAQELALMLSSLTKWNSLESLTKYYK